MVDGESVPMETDQVTVEVRQPDGTIAPQTRTMYSTRYGQITTSIQGQELFAWTDSTAFAFWDANAQNFGRLLNHFLETNQAQSTRELLGILDTYEGIPWVNTIAADEKGRALYADIGSIPNVPDSKATGCASAFGEVTFAALGLPTLDGSRPECAPEQAADALSPRDLRLLFAAVARAPRLRRQRQRFLLAHERGASRSRASRGSSATSAPSARCGPGSGLR